MASKAKAWIQASRLPSQAYILLPLLLGQIIWLQQNGTWNWTVFFMIHLFGLFDQLFIVYANDYMDVEVDRGNTTYNIFSGGSRVIVEGKIAKGALGSAGLSAALICLAISLLLLCAYGLYWAPLFVLCALALLWMYSFPPFSLSYRGGGEFLQMIGVGALLPAFSYYAQAGNLIDFPWGILIPLLPVQLGCAISTALPDYPSDRSGRKRTLAVRLGPAHASNLVVLLHSSGLALFGISLTTKLYSFCSYAYAAGMLLLLLALLFNRDGSPGTRRMNLFVAGSVLFTLLFVVMLMLFN